MKHHYWEAPIVIYLFLGGLGGGIMCLTAIMSLIVNPGTGSLFFVPMFFALAALAIGCFFLVFELGQPLVFWRVWTTATAIIKWGATLLVIAMFSDIFWLLGYLDVLPLDWGFLGAIASVFGGGTPVFDRRYRRFRHHGVHGRHALDSEGSLLLGDPGAARAVHHLGSVHRLRRHRAVAGHLR